MIVNVVGHTYEGFLSSYTYKYKGATVPTPQEVKRLAGDFADIVDYELVDITVKYKQLRNGVRTIRDEIVVKPWDSEDNEQVFLEGQA